MSQKLRTHLDTFNRTYGDTKDGADWCVKALHPSDPATEIRGIPDQTAVPTLLMNYQTTATISPTPGSTGVWNFDAVLLPHPIDFMYIDQYDSVHPTGVESNILNSQIAGTQHYQKWNSFKAVAQRWRLAYMSVTIYQDGPDLANQGTIVVSQAPVEGIALYPGRMDPTNTLVWCAPKTVFYTPEDRPSFNASQSMPCAYFNRSRDGAYVPLKLTETNQDWFSEKDQEAISQPMSSNNGVYVVPIVDTPAYPHVSLNPVWSTVPPAPVTMYASPTSPMLQSNWAFISARNLSVQTSYSFYIRCGLEMMVSTTSSFAPQLKLSPQYDPRALDTYFAIARELKDAYPADYNDLGKIWNVISKAAKKVLPVIKMLPMPMVQQAAQLAEGAVNFGDNVRERRQNRKIQRKPRQVPAVVKPKQIAAAV